MLLKSAHSLNRFFYLKDVTSIHFPLIDSEEASLHVYESGTHVPFPIQRLFTIKTREECNRGFHAHKECTQLLVCLEGQCIVTVDDGEARKEIVLDQPSLGLLIPPSIWAEQVYKANTVLAVLTDRPYEETDYIRKYEDFLEFRKEP
jgi:UDP-2-acetamido-3-amino-2,3-dideoxy-glucuronate N-acetyltransferase